MNKRVRKLLSFLKRTFQRPVPSVSLMIFVIFSYNLFLKKRIEFSNEEEKTITLNLKYFGKDVTFFSERVEEKGRNRSFYNVDIKSNDGKVKAGFATAETQKDILFKDGVDGSNDKWIFKSEEGRYISVKDNIIVNLFKNVDAYNQEDDVRIKCDNFRLSNSYKDLQIRDNCLIEKKDLIVKCQEAKYREEDKIFHFKDSVVLETYRESKEGKEAISIESSEIDYDSNTKIAKSDKFFSIKYKNVLIKGKAFEYKDSKFTTKNRIKIINKENDLEINTDHGDYENGIVLKGNIEGKYKGMDFKADRAHSKDGMTIIDGNIELKDRDKSLICDKIEYKNNLMIAYSNSQKDVTVQIKDNIIKSVNVKYNTDSKDIIFENETAITYKDGSITSSYLLFNEKSEVGHFRDMILKQKNFNIISKNVAFDMKNEKYLLENGVEIEKESLLILPKKVVAIANDVTIPGEIYVYDKKSKARFQLKDGKYDKKSEIFTSYSKLVGVKDDYIIESGNISYNNRDGVGILKEKVEIKNKKDKFFFIADNGKYIESEGALYMPNPKGKKEDLSFIAKNSIFRRESSDLELIDEVKVSKDKFLMDSKKVSYNLSDNSLSFEGETSYLKDDFLILSKRGLAKIDNENVEAENVVLIRENGDIIEADYLEIDKKMEKVSVIGNVKGDLSKGVIFKSEKGNLFFAPKNRKEIEEDKNNKEVVKKSEDKNIDIEEDIKEKYRLTRAELHKNIEFKYKDMDIYSDYLEYDSGLGAKKLELVFAKENLKFKAKTPESNTEMVSKYAFYELKSEIGKMRQDVVVTCKHKKYGTINATSIQAINDNKLKVISLSGNVEAHGSKNDLNIFGDDVELNLNTGIVKSRGRAKFEYDVNNKISEERSVEEEELKDEVVKEFEDEISNVKNISDKYEGFDNSSIFEEEELEEEED